MKEKINVLVLPSDKTGVGKFRSIDPHVFLQNLYPDDFHVDIDYEPKINDLNYWKKYQIIHAHRTIGLDYNVAPQLIEKPFRCAVDSKSILIGLKPVCFFVLCKKIKCIS